MALKNKKRFRIFGLSLLILIVVLYLLTSLIPFVNPYRFWFIALLGLAYPFLLIALFLSLVICILFKSKWMWLPIIALILNWQQLSVLFAFHPGRQFDFYKDENTIRILCWNVSSWTENRSASDKDTRIGLRNLMMDAVQMQNADVLCFQEFFEGTDPVFFPTNIGPLEKMGYKFYFFTPTSKLAYGTLQTGLAIFSRFPIKDSAFFNPVPGVHSEGFSYVDLNVQGKIIRIFNTHLESAGISRQDYTALDKAETSRGVLGKIRRAYLLRSKQSDSLRSQMDQSPYPLIFCGDVDDVPNSYAYFKLKRNLQDAFLKRGWGLGRTFQFISPTLRIDYILADPQFEIQQFSKLEYKYSDHYPLLMDLRLKH